MSDSDYKSYTTQSRTQSENLFKLNLVSPFKLVREIPPSLTTAQRLAVFWLPYCRTGINTDAERGTVDCKSNLLPKKGKNMMKFETEILIWEMLEESSSERQTVNCLTDTNTELLLAHVLISQTVFTMICASEAVL